MIHWFNLLLIKLNISFFIEIYEVLLLGGITHVPYISSKKTRSNQQQMNMLIEFMENHPEFAAGRYLGPQVSHTSKALWEQLAEQLAEIGPAKSVDQLKTVSINYQTSN